MAGRLVRPPAAAAHRADVEGDEAAVVASLVGLLARMREDVEIAVEVAPNRLAAHGHGPDDVLGPLRAAGFHVYRVPDDYRAASYPAQMRRGVTARPPVRFDEPVTVQHDLVLSRVDAAHL
ncbi:hypothetical protein [Actinomycetospora straminea]|uniref:Uncharacterized protein n=1 Tax=Actinomycetospora straminea TaxID=663607 RepID=A0ABP9EZG2_9PSEU|nr:hypothetical protein [Actinomycetospora straminea]MDD7935520.1 hypothetical protein [Actinomycetospora straminea]